MTAMADIPHPDLLADIRAFCAARNIKPTRFGKMVLGDTRFVSDLEKGRELRRRTLEHVRRKMAEMRSAEVTQERGAA